MMAESGGSFETLVRLRHRSHRTAWHQSDRAKGMSAKHPPNWRERMARFLLMVYSSPKAGQEQDYHTWYQQQHLDDVVALEGFVGASRYAPVAMPGLEEGNRFLAVYEIEAESHEAAMQTLAERGSEMTMSPGFDPASVKMQLFKSIGERVSGS